MHIGYATYLDARDVRSWSGTYRAMGLCLEQAGMTVEYLGPLKPQYNPINLAKHAINRFVFRKNDHPHRDPGFLRHAARQVEHKLAHLKVDAIFGNGVLPLAHIQTNRPIVVWADCTFATLLNYYSKFSNMSARSIRDGHAADQMLFDRCALAMFSSKWAADSAIKDYHCDPAKVRVLGLGSNLPGFADEREALRIIEQRPKSPIRLFLAGVDWHRKGADTAVLVAKELHRRGVAVELLIAGCQPPEGDTVPEYVKLLGFISKSTPEGVARLRELYSTSHFFILPTRADCTPIVYCEASAYALPSLATKTGGVESVVQSGKNGDTFALNASPSAYADYIQHIMADENRYRDLCLATYREYTSRLNWNTVGQQAKQLIEKCVQEHGR